jgi:hypothetical protein
MTDDLGSPGAPPSRSGRHPNQQARNPRWTKIVHIHPLALQGALSGPAAGGCRDGGRGLSGRDYAGFGMRTSENSSHPRTQVNRGKQGEGPERNFLLLDVR